MDKIYYQLKLIHGQPFGTFANFPAFNLFSTRHFGNAKDEASIRWIEEKTGRDLAYASQVHGSTILKADKKGNLGEGDGLILENNLLGGVFTADCQPIIFSDLKGQHVAVVHAGWQGALKGIALKAAKTLLDSGAKELVAAIGPSARPCCYEVQEDLYEKFAGSWPKESRQVFYRNDGRLVLDLDQFHQLILEGVVSKLYHANQCTICSKDYHSYRREKTTARQIGIVGRRI